MGTDQLMEDSSDPVHLVELDENGDDVKRQQTRPDNRTVNGDGDKEECFLRLKKLLDKCNMYTEYLVKRMERQQRGADSSKTRFHDDQRQLQQSSSGTCELPTGNYEPPSYSCELPGENCETPRGNCEPACGTCEPFGGAYELPSGACESPGETCEPPGDTCEPPGIEQADESPARKKARLLSPEATDADMKIADSGLGDVRTVQAEHLRCHDGVVIPEAQPTLMTGGVLRPYQLDGYLWIRMLYENGINGILADEMGLGKTVQCIAFFSHLAYMGVPGPFLICAPLSTIPNWCSEFRRFAPTVPVVLYHGRKEERKLMLDSLFRPVEVREGVSVCPVVITSYEVAMVDQRHLSKHDWRYMVVDEGHRLKNTDCRLIRSLRLYNATHRLLLTGTPLQNSLSELWSLLNFVLPEIFDDLNSFQTWFSVENIGDDMVEDERRKGILSMIHQILTPFVLRRLKADVDLRIPPKKEVLVYAPLLQLQRSMYAALINRTIFSETNDDQAARVDEGVSSTGRPTRKASRRSVDYSLMMPDRRHQGRLRRRSGQTCWEGDEEDDEGFESWINAIMENKENRGEEEVVTEVRSSQRTVKLHNIMMQLRKCCSHPFLLEHPIDRATGELVVDESVVSRSGKMVLLDRMLDALRRRNHKVLIFSQMTRMLDLLEDYCVLRRFTYCRLDGSTSIDDRMDSILEYQSQSADKFLFLLSTRAGGLGINLTAADTVIIYDSDWNPQCDLQAQDRCHRIGQTKPVVVYRFVTANTIDQRMVERASAKRKLERMVIHRGKFKSGVKNFKTSLEPLTGKELLELLTSKDHESEVGGGCAEEEVISEADLNSLLDRSDLNGKWQEGEDSKTSPQLPSPIRSGGKVSEGLRRSTRIRKVKDDGDGGGGVKGSGNKAFTFIDRQAGGDVFNVR